MLNFILNKAILLNWNSLAVLFLDPERAFTEDSITSREYNIRASSIQLLKMFITYIDEEKMTKLIEQLL